ncbi:class A beta-lactamase, subclass A2 [uncultured Parabacteroides sp.]|uniref:class A beta-lactamase, subclass A2 n=1 Tax=uncultured Parabacteroides sp. TaxID=512312 RepID=UPI00261D61CF|nr:class A beta-lactamase, subclass A2 [uncultured Parabacteroides sp.]
MGKYINAVLSILFLFALPAVAKDKKGELEIQLQETIANKKAQVGIAIIINGKDTITLNNEVRYPMMSVFKFHQALSVMHYLEQNGLSLATPVYIKKNDLLPNTYSPLRDQYPQGNVTIPISELLIYTLQLSDNNACDILFKHTVGVKDTDTYIRSLGIRDFSITQTEEDMHRDLLLCYQNWTSPLEAAKLLDILVSRPLFADTLQTFIQRTMIECETGKDRLAQPLQATNVIIGHKTGTGDRNAQGQLIGTNDIGFVFLPDGKRYTIAVLVKDSEESQQATAEIISDISRIVYRYIEPSAY